MTHKNRTPFAARVLRTSLIVSAFTVVGCVQPLDVEEEFALESEQGSTQEIVGGTNTSIAQNAWQVSVQTSSGSHFCGGSVIGADYVLTANHCLEGTSASSVRVVAGVAKLSDASLGQIRSVAEIIRYPGYIEPSRGKDVAILRLSSPLDLSGSSVKAIRIADAADASAGLINAGTSVRVTGWGALSSGGGSPNTLQSVDVPVVSNTAAQNAYTGETITSDQIGAGIIGQGGKDSCQGDSGGPLSASDGAGGRMLVGVVSWGYGCADPRWPGMYARVTSFASWINDLTSSVDVNLLSQNNVSDAKDGFRRYSVDVPSGATSFTVSMAGGSGDADLYVRRGQEPSTSSYDCRPYLAGNVESCSFDAPAAGTWHIAVHAYSAYSGLSLNANIRTSNPVSGPMCGDGVCSAGEDCGSCASDCGTCAPTCGDGVCGGSEDCGSCASDCGTCAPTCGDGVCNGDETCGSCGTDCGSCGGDPVILASDDFSSNGWNGGSGFTSSWSRSGDTAISSGGARLRRSTGDINRTVNVSGASGLVLRFHAAVDGFESNDQAYLKIRVDGGSWTTLGTFTSSQSDSTWHSYEADLSAYDGANTIGIRFDAQMSSTGDRFFVDNVSLEGVQ